MHMSLRTLLGEVDVQNALARLRLTWVQFQLTAEVHSDLPHGRGKIEVTTKDQGLSTRGHACSTATNMYSSPSLSRRRRRARTLASRRALAVGRVGFSSGAGSRRPWCTVASSGAARRQRKLVSEERIVILKARVFVVLPPRARRLCFLSANKGRELQGEFPHVSTSLAGTCV